MLLQKLENDDSQTDWYKLSPTESTIVMITQFVGILVHFLLLVFMAFNLCNYVMKLKKKPYSILLLYVASCVTLLSLIVTFTVIKDPNSTQLIIEFSALFIAEWGV